MNADIRQRLGAAAALFGLVAISVLSLAPIHVPEVIGWHLQDKLLHLLAYAALGAAAYEAGLRRLWAVMAILLFGALLEVLQGLTGYRQSEWLDLLADGLGATAGVAAATLWRRP